MLTGIDILKNSRIDKMMARSPEAIKDIFSQAEIDYCTSRPHPSESFAARFAAKEALIKAIDSQVLEFDLYQLEVVRTESGKPEFNITSQYALKRLRTLMGTDDYTINLALSHEDEYAVAMVVVSRK